MKKIPHVKLIVAVLAVAVMVSTTGLVLAYTEDDTIWGQSMGASINLATNEAREYIGNVDGFIDAVAGKELQKATEETIEKATGLHEDRQNAARQAAVDWALDIAEDDSFHYGEPKWAHHNGCYFCGTNQKKGSIKRKAGASLKECEKTYCCNPFVTAAYMHGAGAPEVDCRKHDMRIGLSGDSNKVLKNTDAFERVEKKSIQDLEIGDILLTPTHAMLYAGDGLVVEAAHHDEGVQDGYWADSIRCAPLKDRQWKRTKLIYRYIGTGAF